MNVEVQRLHLKLNKRIQMLVSLLEHHKNLYQYRYLILIEFEFELRF
jgi:hypothetical protein